MLKHGSRFNRIAVTLLGMGLSLGAAAQAWQPQKNVEIVVGAAPGGTNDRTARTVEKIISDGKLVPTSTTVVNRPGGGGNLASTYVHQRTGDAHYLLLVNTAVAASHIIGASKLSHTDFTPIATLLDDYVVFVVNASSPMKTGKDLAARLRKDPQSLTIGFANALGNVNHIAVGLLMKALGGNARDLKVVVFKGSSEALPALLGGHIEVMPTAAGNVSPHLASGKLRAVAVGAEKRFGGTLSAIPTWREQGLDVVSGGARGIFGPKDLTPAQVAYWEGVLRKVTDAPEWKAYLEKNFSADEFLTGEALRKYLDRDYAAAKAVLSDLGLAK